MTWARLGDTAATHPRLLAVLDDEDADDRILNETFGFLLRCAALSGAHMTDYIVSIGTARAMAGSVGRYRELTAVAQAAGLLVPVEVPGEDGAPPAKAFRIFQDPEFIHLRLKAEVDWERQRRADVANTAITGPVRARDGDACRYCGKVVDWKARRGNRQATYDHVHPGEGATIDTLVVACGVCNKQYGDRPHESLLLPVPAKKIISPLSAAWLATECGINVEATYSTPAELTAQTKQSVRAAANYRKQAEAAAADDTAAPAPPGSRPDNEAVKAKAFQKLRDDAERAAGVTPSRARPHPVDEEEPQESGEDDASVPDLQVQQVRGVKDLDSPGRVGAGRDGPGRDGAGRAGPGGRPLESPRGQPVRARSRPQGKKSKRKRRKGR